MSWRGTALCCCTCFTRACRSLGWEGGKTYKSTPFRWRHGIRGILHAFLFPVHSFWNSRVWHWFILLVSIWRFTSGVHQRCFFNWQLQLSSLPLHQLLHVVVNNWLSVVSNWCSVGHTLRNLRYQRGEESFEEHPGHPHDWHPVRRH